MTAVASAPAIASDGISPRDFIYRPAWRAAATGLILLGGLSALLGSPVPVAVAFLAVVAPVLVLRPVLTLAIVVATVASNAPVVLVSAGVPDPYLVLFGVATIAAIVGVRRGQLALMWSPVYVTVTILLAAQALSMLVARDQHLALSTVWQNAQYLLLVPLVATLSTARNALRIAAVVAVLIVGLLSALTLVQEFVLHNTTTFGGFSNIPQGSDPGGLTVRHSGPFADMNFWARNVVLFLPFALTFAWRGRPWLRVLGISASAAMLGALYLTQSRGGYIAAVVAIVAWLALSGPATRILLWCLPGIAVALAMLPGVGTRLGTIGLVSEAGAGAGDPSLVGRVSILRTGLAMVEDRFATGVGAGNFQLVSPEYQRRIGLTTPTGLAPHNLYLQMAAETGIVGLAAWCVFYASAVFVVVRASMIWRRLSSQQSDAAWMGPPLIASLLGWATASLFLHLAEFRVLLLVVAFGVALDILARERAGRLDRLQRSRSQSDTTRSAYRARNRKSDLLAACAALAVFGVAGCAAPFLGLRVPQWEARAYGVVSPRDGAGADAYTRSVATRPVVAATFAAIESATEPVAGLRKVSVTASPTSTMLTMVARASTPEQAARTAANALTAGVSRVNSLGAAFTIVPVPAQPDVSSVSQFDQARVAALVTLTLVVCTVAFVSVRRATRRTHPGSLAQAA